MCMKNLNKNYPFSLFYSFTIYCLNSQQHATTPPPYQITHVVSRLKPPRGITLIPTWGETERWGLYKQVSSFGWSFMRGAINHILTQSILLVSNIIWPMEDEEEDNEPPFTTQCRISGYLRQFVETGMLFLCFPNSKTSHGAAWC